MLKAVLGVLLASSMPTAATAVTVVATGQGTIYRPDGGDLIDLYGLFGQAGASLIGKTTSITISIDLSATPPLFYGDGSELVNSGLFNAYPGDDPLRTKDIGEGSISISGITRLNDGSSTSSYALWSPANQYCSTPTACVVLSTFTGPGRLGGTNGLSLKAGGFTSGAPTGLFDVPTSANLCDRVTICEGAFSFTTLDENFFGSVKLSSLSLTQGAVPEPATWMMMILGFGAIGYAMRRKRAFRQALD